MRFRWLGLCFAFVVCCLMCLPFIVSSEAPPEPASSPRIAHDAALLPASPAHPDSDSSLRPDPVRIPADCPGTVENPTRRPTADANGLPILASSYIRSNYAAFCLTGSGG